jgi:phosphorylcholine metabolism protein LicD
MYTGKPLWYHKIILEEFFYLTDLLEKNEIKYWLDCGTLLGAVRDGCIIPWDNDCDISILHDDANRVLSLTEQVIKDGYVFTVDRNNIHARIIRLHKPDNFDFHVDIFTWYEEKGKYPACVNNAKIKYAWHEKDEIDNLGEVEFEGKMFPCPKPPEDTLERFFGEDWRTPKFKTAREILKYDPDNEDIKKEIAKWQH